MKKRIVSLMLCATMTATLMAGCGLKSAEEVKNQVAIQEMDAVVESLETANIISHSDTAGKEETVYVLLDADGNENQTIVSEWLKNPEGAKTMTDNTTLTDMQVVKGSATLVENGNDKVTFNTDGGDVYYQGSTTKEAPVSMKVTYELDGKAVNASDIKNATGHLKVSYDYTNNVYEEVTIKGQDRKIYQPFTMVSGTLFDNETASNVTVSNGRSVNTGDRTIVIGMAMPGLAESLGIEEIDEIKDVKIPESVVIEADVENFSMPMTMTFATNNALEDLGITDMYSLDDLSDKTAQLTDGMFQLEDGATQLNDGVGELYDGTNTLKDGTKKLYDGADELNAGGAKLKGGVDELNDGAKRLAAGTAELSTGANTLKDGLHQLSDKTPALADGVNKLSDGATQIDNGMKAITANNAALKTGSDQLVAGLTQVDDSITASATSMAALQAGAAQLNDGVAALAGENGVPKLVSTIQTSAQLTGSAAQVLGALNSLPDSQLAAMGISKDQLGQLVAGLNQYTSTVSANNLGAVNEQVSALAQGAGAVKGGVDQTVASMSALGQGVGQLKAGATSLQTGIYTYTAGVDQAAAGVTTLTAGVGQLKGQLPALTDGVGKLVAGADTLAVGAGKINTGAGQLADGTETLAAGSNTLADGITKLFGGTKELNDGAIKLADGVMELYDGTNKLRDGVFEFDEKGISKLTNLLDNDIEKYYDRLVAVRDFSKEYTSFAGASDDVETTVKFIYKTEAVE